MVSFPNAVQGNCFMSTLNEILTKKDYSKKGRFATTDASLNSGKPAWLKFLFILCIILAAMGDQKLINSLFGALPKAISIGAIGLAFFYGIYIGDSKSLKKILAPTIMYISLMAFMMIYSLIIWILGFTDLSSIMRGGSKMGFQMIAVLVAISGAYLFGKESIKLFLIAFCISNALIMLIEMPRFGFGASVSSLVHAIVTFGDAKGYARTLEIHDLTFIMGQFSIYYLLFAPKATPEQRKERRRGIAASLTFFIVGMKRIAFLAVGFAILLGLLIRNRKNNYRIVMGIGIFMTIFSFVFIYMVRSGILMSTLEMFGIDTMGRTSAWDMASEYYEFSPTFLGRGFESVDAIVKEWVVQGKAKKALPLHNDYLKMFIELGFYGYTLWVSFQYILYPIIWKKVYNSKVACMYMCLFMYMSVTYMTDNTAFLYWSTVALRLLPMAFACGEEKEQPALKWRPPTNREIEYRIQELCNEKQ